MDKIKIDRPVICEGKYDKIKLNSIIDAHIITTDGFGIFREHEKLALIKKLAQKNGIIIFTDSDGAGLVIRNYFNSVLQRDKVIHLYIPEIPGKEKRKKMPSKAGLLGVEGIEAEKLRNIFLPFASDKNIPQADSASETRTVTKTDFYTDGLSGGVGSEEKRQALAKHLDLPGNMSANALLAAINLLYSYDSYKESLEIIENDSNGDILQ